MTIAPTGDLQRTEKSTPMPNANLCKRSVIVQGNPRHFDADFPVAKSPFPYISKATEGDRVITKFSETTGYDVRGW